MDREERTVVSARGQIDSDTAPALKTVIGGLVGAGHTVIAVDLGDVDFIGSVGLNLLIELDQGLRHRGGHLLLRAPSPHVLRVLDITGLTERFSLDVTTAAAARERWQRAASELEHWLRCERERDLSPEEAETEAVAAVAEREWWSNYQALRLREGLVD